MNPFADELLEWFAQHSADLPWRHDRDPYYVWLSEIMLQQTQVATVVGYFERFLQRFPTVEALATAPLDDVLKMWEGLGYYSRARNLHKCAQVVVVELDAKFPSTADELQQLPGIGRYTAGAIASLAFGQDTPVVDGNVIRIFARVFDIADDVSQTAVQRAFWDRATELVPPGRAGAYNEALMELGRVVCKPRNPLCDQCPIRRHCEARKRGSQAERPVKRRRPPVPHYDVAAGVIFGSGSQEGRFLIAQRPAEGLLGSLWEFPGGKQEPGETMQEALARELQEELGITVSVGEFLVKVKHAFTHFRITLHAYACHVVAGDLQRIGVADFAWVTLDDLANYAFGKADQQVIAELRERPNRLI